MGVEDELDKAMVNIAGVEGEFTVTGVKGTLVDEVDVEESKEGTRPAVACRTHPYNGLTDEHALHGCTFLSFASAVYYWACEAQQNDDPQSREIMCVLRGVKVVSKYNLFKTQLPFT